MNVGMWICMVVVSIVSTFFTVRYLGEPLIQSAVKQVLNVYVRNRTR